MRSLQSEFTSGVRGGLSGAGRAFEAPAMAARGLIPMQDMGMEALGTAGMASLGGAAMTRPRGSVGMGGRVAGEALPEPRNAAERMARDILDMRAQGRAGEVTDDMMAAADPQYMFANTPLPMDEASRRDRAAERFDIQPLYHGTASDVQGFDNNQRGSITQVPSARAAHWLTGRYDVAGPYADLAATKPVQDLMDASRNAEIDGNWDLAESLMADAERLESIGGSGQNVMQLYGPRDVLSFDAKGASYDPTDYPLMDKVAAAKNDGYQAVRINDFVDNADWGSGRAASHIGVFNPTNIRSRFARFDPEFAHLSNLSAANASPLAGIAGLSAEDQAVIAGMDDPQEIEDYIAQVKVRGGFADGYNMTTDIRQLYSGR